MPTIREQLASLFGLSISDPKPEKPIAIEPKRKLQRRKKSAENSSGVDSSSVSRSTKRKKKRGATRKWVERRRLEIEKAGSIRYRQGVSFENIHNAYNPPGRTLNETQLKKVKAGASHTATPSSRQSTLAVVICKFCNHPAISGDSICRQCSSD